MSLRDLLSEGRVAQQPLRQRCCSCCWDEPGSHHRPDALHQTPSMLTAQAIRSDLRCTNISLFLEHDIPPPLDRLLLHVALAGGHPPQEVQAGCARTLVSCQAARGIQNGEWLNLLLTSGDCQWLSFIPGHSAVLAVVLAHFKPWLGLVCQFAQQLLMKHHWHIVSPAMTAGRTCTSMAATASDCRPSCTQCSQ
jgi:hypothetical protein